MVISRHIVYLNTTWNPGIIIYTAISYPLLSGVFTLQEKGLVLSNQSKATGAPSTLHNPFMIECNATVGLLSEKILDVFEMFGHFVNSVLVTRVDLQQVECKK